MNLMKTLTLGSKILLARWQFIKMIRDGHFNNLKKKQNRTKKGY